MARVSAGMSEPAAQRVGNYLLSADPREIRSLQDMFVRAQTAATAPTRVPSALAAGLNAPRDANERSR